MPAHSRECFLVAAGGGHCLSRLQLLRPHCVHLPPSTCPKVPETCALLSSNGGRFCWIGTVSITGFSIPSARSQTGAAITRSTTAVPFYHQITCTVFSRSMPTTAIARRRQTNSKQESEAGSRLLRRHRRRLLCFFWRRCVGNLCFGTRVRWLVRCPLSAVWR